MEITLLNAVRLLADLTERLLREPKTKALQTEARTVLKTLDALELLIPPEPGTETTGTPEPGTPEPETSEESEPEATEPAAK